MACQIRNFSIIAHIDHGKSTLADRILELTGAVKKRDMQAQLLDNMDLERERGITIKARAVGVPYEHAGVQYALNLIDTPGHVDFSYEVSRSLKACEGALLLVDAAQGVEAQTVANAFLAIEQDLEIIPVINKVDLVNARTDQVIEELHDQFGFEAEDIIKVSAKTGEGLDELMEALCTRIPAPKGDVDAPLRAMIFDATYDDYRGVVAYVRIIDGRLATRDKVRMIATGGRYEALEVGTFSPSSMNKADALEAGAVGYVICNIKRLSDVKVGDTLTLQSVDDVEPLPGFLVPQPMVYCGLYPTNNADYEVLRKALDKLGLNDSSFSYTPESSAALGFGFRCGFLGLLHMEIVQERLERESDIDIVQTAPNVTYQVIMKDGSEQVIHSPTALPDVMLIDAFREPIVRAQLIIPSVAVGNTMKLCEEKRGDYINQEYLSKERVILTYDLPLGEILYDFYDKYKSATKGYGTMDYALKAYVKADLVKLSILVNSIEVDALSVIMHRENCEYRGRRMLIRLRREIPRQMFDVPLQAGIGGKIIARETLKGMRKDVIAKCYGGDISRKKKLLEKQKAGKRRMKTVGNVEIPQQAFMAVLKPDDAEIRGR